MKQKNIIFAVLLVLLAVLGRVVSHPLNFTPLLAVGLFAGSRLRPMSLAMAIVLVSMLVSDTLLGWHSTMPYTYGSMILITWGSTFFNQGSWWKQIGLSSLGAAVIFWVATNFGVWHMEGIYSQDLQGLQNCYVAAIPFFKNTLTSTLVYLGALRGFEQLASRVALPENN